MRSLVGVNTVDLSQADIKSMSVDIRRTEKTICPRQPVQMAVFAEAVLEGESKPKSLETWQGGGSVNKNGKLDFADFAFHSPQGAFDAEGWFAPNPDLLATADKEFALTTAYRRRPDKFTFTVTYKPDYTCIHGANFSGASGSSGSSGASGESGSMGSPGSESSDGGNGSDGHDGSPGASGSSGGDGPEVQAYVTWVKTPFYEKLAAVQLVGPNKDFLLFSPEQTITIASNGGNGGSGGRGGNGGSGGSGGSGHRGGNGGKGGSGANGGAGGNGGRGGHLVLTYDSRYPELAGLIQLQAEGGAGGAGGSGGSAGSSGSGGSSRGTGGSSGSMGNAGSSGSMGTPGSAGAPGQTQKQAGSVEQYFANLPGITPL